MGTIAQKLTYLEDTKTAIGNAIAAKGGSVTGKTFRQYATEISNLPSGGSNQDLIDLIECDITSLNIPSGTTKIGKYAFYNYNTLTSITIPGSVTSIGDSAFYHCSGLTSVTIPNSVTNIDTNAFCDCTGLTSVTIPNSVTSIGSIAFANCSGLTSVTVNADTPPSLGNNGFNNTNECPIYVPAASVDTYKTTFRWSSLASRIQAIPT